MRESHIGFKTQSGLQTKAAFLWCLYLKKVLVICVSLHLKTPILGAYELWNSTTKRHIFITQ